MPRHFGFPARRTYINIHLPKNGSSVSRGLTRFYMDLHQLDNEIARLSVRKDRREESPIRLISPPHTPLGTRHFLVIHVVWPRNGQVVAQYHFHTNGKCTVCVLKKRTKTKFIVQRETHRNEGARLLVNQILDIIQEPPDRLADPTFIEGVELF